MLMSGLSLTTGHVAPLKHMSLLEKWSFFKSRALKKALAWESCAVRRKAGKRAASPQKLSFWGKGWQEALGRKGIMKMERLRSGQADNQLTRIKRAGPMAEERHQPYLCYRRAA